MFGRTILMLLLLWKQDAVNSVRLTELRVPAHEREGGKALLSCHYDMENDILYSVKWYKDGVEFYRYIPENDPPVYFFPTQGVEVDMSRSSNNAVALMNLTQDSAGYYRCEVSGEAPKFTTVYKQKYISIHLLPRTIPQVTGLQEQYNIDDLLIANCSLPPSRPKATLEWMVNDQPVPPDYIQGPWYRVTAERPDAPETILQLKFRVETSHFVNGAINLKCQGTIAPMYQEKHESRHYIALPFTMNDPTPVSQDTKDDSASTESQISAVLLPIIVVLVLI